MNFINKFRYIFGVMMVETSQNNLKRAANFVALELFHFSSFNDE